MTSGGGEVTGGLVDVAGTDWYRIDHVERMEPFLMTVVSDADLWMFVSSAGPLTAGRVDADGAFLPYETDDRLHRAVGVTGPVTILAREHDGRRELWEPFGRRCGEGCTRAVAKRALGNALVLEERNAAWGLTYRATWEPSRAYGWARTVELVDDSGQGATVEVLDGLLDVMPAGVDATTEQLTSNLVDAYKRSEVGRWGSLAVYTLESLITDRAEPAEALAATVVWSAGLDDAVVHLDERVVGAVRRGEDRAPVGLLTGRRGAYLLHATVDVPAGGARSWLLVADTSLGHAEVNDRVTLAADPEAAKHVADDVATGAEHLEALLAGADAFQHTGDPIADAHHLSNVLFNGMRGGIFPYGYRIPVADLLDFLRTWNSEVHARHAASIDALGDWVELEELHATAEASGDPDLVRLVLEYLPLTFSRRHGDPSRPWNRFAIRVQAEDGAELLAYEGNWRDIFQNWEALLRSYPLYAPHVVAKFVNASTVDGHNPYRISRDGIDWEVPDPDDPWGNIGYWGDHQIVYLLRLLEGWEHTDPAGLARWLDRRLFTYADVPYRLVGHEAMVRDPRDTIEFDELREQQVCERVADLGADGRLVTVDGELVHVTLDEKLLVPALAKLSAYVAGGGIWMNTQRPEWNDANNALAGYGLSMVTLYQLERYLGFLRRVVVGDRRAPLSLSGPVAAWLTDVSQALAEHDAADAVDDTRTRRRLLDSLAGAGERYRAAVADAFDATPVEVEPATVDAMLETALDHLRASTRGARRADGLYDAYDLVSFPSDGEARVHRLAPMLEGQVAVLGTTALGVDDVLALVDALFDSPLYRADQSSFMLYPATVRPSFLDRNTVPSSALEAHPFLHDLAGPGGPGILERDARGALHFRPGLANAAVLERAMQASDLDAAQRGVVHDVYEDLFDHHAFTGRSGGMYGYEGIGSIYWHMVSKLLVAVQERYLEAVAGGVDEPTLRRLAEGYRRIRDGLGFRKDPVAFGAIPTDCYSHTPGHSGAQQPGMTGQVKEEVLARFGELGIVIADGRVGLQRPLLPADELWADDGAGYRWTLCGIPLRVRPGDHDAVRVARSDGSVTEHEGSTLAAADSAALFHRNGDITEVEFVTTLGGAA
jgi:hypothetical protein